ncbi:M23 family metallopeptidase [Rickettsiales bacterium]|nr:M23 family metallopeptidase [Rickettsiales bacterium]
MRYKRGFNLKKSLLNLLSRKDIVISTRCSTIRYSIGPVKQIILLILIACSVIYTLLSIGRFVFRKKLLNNVYLELFQLRSVNKELHNKVTSISKDLDAFADYISDKSDVCELKGTLDKRGASDGSGTEDDGGKDGKSAARDQKTKALISNQKVLSVFDSSVHQLAMINSSDTLNRSIFGFVHAVNVKIANLLKNAESTKFNPYRFLNEGKGKMDMVKLSSSIIYTPNSSFLEKYKKRIKYYYYRSDVLDESLSVHSFFRPAAKKVVGIIRSLEAIIESFPLNYPFASNFAITSKFGPRIDPITRSHKSFHKGMDMSAGIGASIYATGDGIISFAGFKKTYGYMVDINHGYGLVSRYAHMSGLAVKNGQKVSAMDVIGYQGKTGSRCKGSHLHYEILENNKQINPMNYIYAKNIIKNNRLAWLQG